MTNAAAVESLLIAALEQPTEAERAAFLDAACAGQAELRGQVEKLLNAHVAAGDFLQQPVIANLSEAPEQPDATQTLDGSSGNRGKSGLRTEGEGASGPEHSDLGFLQPSSRPDSLGRIGHYEVLQVLGKGGFGIVFRAFDDVLQRVVALKVMAPQLAATSPARKRFIREAQSSAKVRHDHVVQVYEIGEHPLPHLTMEFIPGETLQQRLDRIGPVEPAEVVRIGRQIAEGLAAAHATDLIHRDIKPGNILLEGSQQRVKITDFGLARAADDASISQSGIIAGTPMYMAPEQAKGEKLDQRADLFSLGSVLYQMVTGRAPFRANSTVAVLKRVAEDTPRDIREIIPETPQWLCAIIAKLHEKNPDDRFQSAREVADVLADCESQLKANGTLKDFSRIPGGIQKQRRIGRMGQRAAATVLLFLAVAVGAYAGPFALRYVSNRGRVTFFNDQPGDQLLVRRDSQLVATLDSTHRRVNLAAGEYDLEAVSADGAAVTSVIAATRRLFESGPGRSADGPVLKLTVERGDAIRVGFTVQDRVSPPTPSPDTAGWIPLFNGKDLTGWKTHPDQPGEWKVENGVLVGSTVPSYLFSDSTFRDFHLRVEAKINHGGDSSIFLRAPFAMRPGRIPAQARPAAGYEVEIQENPNYPNRTGSVLDADTEGPPKLLAKNNLVSLTRADEWFTLEIIAQGNRIITKVNGTLAADCRDPRSRYDAGRLAIQLYSPRTVVQFRKIEIKELLRGEPRWVDLYNRKNLAGWKPHIKEPGEWSVENGILVGRKGPGYLMSDRTDFENFHLRAECSVTGDSGVFFRIAQRDRIGTGWESQLASNHLSGSLLRGRSRMPQIEAVSVQPGAWFLLDLIAVGKRIVLKVNGITTTEHIADESEPLCGYIALQVLDGATVVQFRKIEIKELPPGQ